MKPTREEREKLADALKRARHNSSLSNSAIAAVAKVDPGQTSRILDGQFRTVSGNVLRICNVLGIDPRIPEGGSPTAKQARRRAAWAKLEASVRRAWDETPQGADRLVAVIDAVAKIMPPGRGDPSDPDSMLVSPAAR